MIKKLEMKYLVLKLNNVIDLDKLIIDLTKLKLISLHKENKKINFFIKDIAIIILNCIIKKDD
jgi:hypothetical protein